MDKKDKPLQSAETIEVAPIKRAKKQWLIFRVIQSPGLPFLSSLPGKSFESEKQAEDFINTLPAGDWMALPSFTVTGIANK